MTLVSHSRVRPQSVVGIYMLRFRRFACERRPLPADRRLPFGSRLPRQVASPSFASLPSLSRFVIASRLFNWPRGPSSRAKYPAHTELKRQASACTPLWLQYIQLMNCNATLCLFGLAFSLDLPLCAVRRLIAFCLIFLAFFPL